MSQGLILFGGRELIGKLLPLPDVHALQQQSAISARGEGPWSPRSAREKMPLTEHCRATAPERMTLPPVGVGTPTAPPAIVQSARARSGRLGAASTVYGAGGFREPQVVRSNHAGFEGHSAATSSTAFPRSSPAKPRRSPSPRSPSPGPAVGSHFRCRPGTEERRSGNIAAADPTTLPRIYSSICKDDVQNASEQLDEAERLASEHRTKCIAEAKEKGRRKAASWRRQQQQRYRKIQEVEDERQQSVEHERGEAAAQAKAEADFRWKKAFERLKSKEEVKDGRKGAILATMHGPSLPEKVPRRSSRHHSGSRTANSRGPSPRPGGEDSSPEPSGRPKEETSDPPRDTELSENVDDAEPESTAKHFSWRLKSVPLDHHIEFLRKVQRLRNRSTRCAQTYEARKMRFMRLPEEVRSECETSYLLFGPDPYMRVLDVLATRECLHELGARGIALDEQLVVLRSVAQVWKHAVRTAKTVATAANEVKSDTSEMPEVSNEMQTVYARGGINVYTFGTQILPAARRQLNGIRRAKTEEMFKKHDLEETQFIDLEDCAEIIESITRVNMSLDVLENKAEEIAAEEKARIAEAGEKGEEKLDTKARLDCRRTTKSTDMIPKTQPVPELIAQFAKAKEKEVRRRPSDAGKDSSRRPSDAGKKAKQGTIKSLNMPFVTRLVLECCTAAEIEACQRERQIQTEASISPETFRMMRQDIEALHGLYMKFAHNLERPLTEDECGRIFQEFGMSGVNCEQYVGEKGIDFVDLLDLVEQLRVDVESDSFDELRAAFEDYAKVSQLTQRLPVVDVMEFLASVNFRPTTHEMQSALTRALEDVLAVSAYEDESVGFDQVKRVLQRMKETVRRTARAEQVKAAVSYGFRESELDELHDAFKAVDVDRNGTIEPDEAWESIKALGMQITKKVFMGVYHMVDTDGSGSLGFDEFLKLLSLIRDREGAFATNRHINKLDELLRAEGLHLLTYFHENFDGEAELLEDAAILVKVCECFGVAPDEPVYKSLNAKSFQDLCVAADTMMMG